MSKRTWLSESSSSSSDDTRSEKQPRKELNKNEGGDGIEGHSQAISYLADKGQYSNAASRMMAKMGYRAGKGLGSKQQGRVEPVEASKQRGRRGLGLKVTTMEKDIVVEWEDDKAPTIKETVDWIPPCNDPLPVYEELCEWSDEGKKKLTIEDETVFCDEEIMKTMLKCKNVFDDLEGYEMRHARTRSNPYETIRGAIFLNRAAMKMANIDHVFDYMFTSPKGLLSNEMLYFADVCAGPGGFSEYVLWRKKWHAKGFGFTLKGKNDFKLEDFFAANPELFEPYYGVAGDGDIMNTDNLESFQNFVLENTEDKGVHFVMADGFINYTQQEIEKTVQSSFDIQISCVPNKPLGFSVEGQENIQEILTKQLLLCQFACALSIVRVGGCFLCKTFDLFTPFSIGLIYLLRRAFEEITIFKPVTSRPANSERYVVCKGFRDSNRLIGDYLLSINQTLNEMKDTDNDVIAVVPLDVIMEDAEFCTYMKESNEKIASQQCKALAKIHAFSKDRELKEMCQHDVRKECIQLWNIPDKVRAAPPKTNAKECFENFISKGSESPIDLMKKPMMFLTSQNISQLERVYDYRCHVCAGRRTIIVSLGGARIYEWNSIGNRWSQVNDVNCHIPRETILEVEFVQEVKGEGKGQRKNMALHVIDALVLGGENISQKHYTERMNDINLFVTAINKPSQPHLNTVRAKTIFRVENTEEVFQHLNMKKMKGASVLRLCFEIGKTDTCFVPSGLCFTKITKDPWAMAFSKSRNRKYFFNTITKQSSFECPPDFCATYSMCASSRCYWTWEEGIRVHSDQEHRRSDKLSRDDVVAFLQSHK